MRKTDIVLLCAIVASVLCSNCDDARFECVGWAVASGR